jgi:cell division protease FtsH
VSRQQNISEETARKIDAEIKRLVEGGLNEAQQILTARKDDLEALAQGLLEYETLSGDEIRNLLVGKPPVREAFDTSPAPKASAVPSTKGKAKGAKGDETGGLEPQPQA